MVAIGDPCGCRGLAHRHRVLARRIGQHRRVRLAAPKGRLLSRSQDSVAFPRDGSIAVGVNQWSSAGQVTPRWPSRSSMTKPMWIPSSRRSRHGQFQGATDPVTGLEFSTGMLTGGGRPAADWTSACRPTDRRTTAAAARRLGRQRPERGRRSLLRRRDRGLRQRAPQLLLRPPRLRRRDVHARPQHGRVREPHHRRLLERPGRTRRHRGQPGNPELEEHGPLVAAKATSVRAFVQIPTGADPQRMGGRLIGRRGGSSFPAARSPR